MKARLLQILKIIYTNKYYLSVAVFAVWMLFFDHNDVFTQIQYRLKLMQFERDKEYYEKELIKVRADYVELNTNVSKLEKFARERYLMKKDNEDIFVIVPEASK